VQLRDLFGRPEADRRTPVRSGGSDRGKGDSNGSIRAYRHDEGGEHPSDPASAGATAWSRCPEVQISCPLVAAPIEVTTTDRTD